tara:strand:- start:3236 stop:3466 length:231 start_codon:yes stop_codon:yes gene_type:complete
MNPDLSFLIELWDSMKNYIPKKDRLQAAEQLVGLADENLDLSEIQENIMMFDSAMKNAIVGHFGFDEEDEDGEEWD